MKSSYGYFDKNGREFVVTEYDTVMPLINYFWNNEFISGANHHGAGLGCFTERTMQYMHPTTRCIMIRDENRHFYLRDEMTGDVWSPGWYPMLKKLDSYKCRHGLGYTIVESSRRGIQTLFRVFVPVKQAAEIWTITVRNTGKGKRKIKVFTFADFLLKGYEEYADYSSCLYTIYDNSFNALNAFNDAFERPHDRFSAFVASDRKPTGYDGSRAAFLGRYGTISNPQAVIEGACSNSTANTEKLCGALEHTVSLNPGESVVFNVLIGSTNALKTTRDMCAKLLKRGQVEKEFNKHLIKVDRDLSHIFVETPDEKLNWLFNNWIPREIQLHTEVGTDTGRGFRDIMQSAWSSAFYDPEGSKEKILVSLKAQYADGHTLRGWNPVDDHYYSDGPVWIAPTVNTYLKVTGNYDFLKIRVPYFDKGSGSVWEHILASLYNATDDIGARGLVRCRYGDWNDSVNGIGIKGKGESVWTSIGIVFALNEAIEIAENVLGDIKVAEGLKRRKEKLTRAIQTKGWDGNWYLQGINDAGAKIGSHEEKEGKYYLNSQTWAILAGIAKGDRLKKIVYIIDKKLDCKNGSMVLAPAYTKPNPGIGRISWFRPGMWENGAPYCHGGAFKVVADTYLGRGDKAYDTLTKILPDSKRNPSTHSGCPPYVCTNMYFGPDHSREGQILYSWITGTATWLFRALTVHMIGVKPEYDGLMMEPCMPSHWKRARQVCKFRGAEYDITVLNPKGKQTGVSAVTVDGKKIAGNCVPNFRDGKKHTVIVVM
ncbi:MAG: hypothetical protein A2268_07020 [Candidatus Raymondbacteria bacterium RifOxyA12_full_50_37]|uniref:Carbohydrate binding domain-containing protein n=1 Tax=Candidatus Raymondbacteria bacterium RIFOXYD12_FULL_49_13 TaxID=1817890 RepID=A0A1F7FEF6_UNCRA|nr:MAG: hypothetical protein A2268_07020 [Candidatus Raymondbacteria bacterium RifOxyA12_full_50_37]OGJ91136.1 MAG: hypothetical protein A2248_01170 [Candidatus Raymondbacteria bacterium RIFOXYA2_FULL_49_16]OGJ97534.1 MAG: hypothetical protein A2453_01935 [Candidatus Raymondbacteria bacterium RIFOXYC2_FULL_50_21]OGK00162.1 MAG: hypothetical protein A2350_16365 [Candidatus Raymondbacteria bacterium RifOxyB12_full_50_8]OGK05008.1 MAG: hypothetical protein A2519_10045 [Candidatus Raymondbacteria b